MSSLYTNFAVHTGSLYVWAFSTLEFTCGVSANILYISSLMFNILKLVTINPFVDEFYNISFHSDIKFFHTCRMSRKLHLMLYLLLLSDFSEPKENHGQYSYS